jgi:hypothetical protein
LKIPDYVILTVSSLSPEEIQTLEEIHKNPPCHSPRIKAHAVLLSDTGFKLTEIASIYKICRQTAATWLHTWKDRGLCTLFNMPRSGRPRILCNEADGRCDHTGQSIATIIKSAG